MCAAVPVGDISDLMVDNSTYNIPYVPDVLRHTGQDLSGELAADNVSDLSADSDADSDAGLASRRSAPGADAGVSPSERSDAQVDAHGDAGCAAAGESGPGGRASAAATPVVADSISGLKRALLSAKRKREEEAGAAAAGRENESLGDVPIEQVCTGWIVPRECLVVDPREEVCGGA